MFHVDNGEHKLHLMKCVHHWPGEGNDNCSESSTDNENLVEEQNGGTPNSL